MNNEFKKSKSNNETRYTLESMTAGATGSGSIATSAGSVGKVQKRGNILAQEAGKDKVDASKPRNFVAKNAKMGGAGAHKDKKKAQKQGTEKHKKPYMEALKQKIEDLKSKLNEAQGVEEAGTLDRYRDRIGTSGQSDRYRDSQERDHDRRQDHYDAEHQSRLNRVSNSDRMDAARTQHEIDVLAHRLSRMQKDDDDWEKTFDMMRDRLNRYQWSSQRDVDPEQLAAISNIKYEPQKKTEAVQAKTDDKLVAYYAQRKAEKEKQSQQGVAEGVAETVPLGDAQKVLNHYGADYFGSNWEKVYFYKHRKQFSLDLIRSDDPADAGSVNLSDLNAMVRKLRDMRKSLPYKESVAEEFNGEYDDEAGMAQSNLLTTARAVMGLLKTIKDRDNLPEWGQEKIAKAEMMLVSVWDYLQSQKEMGNDPQQGVAEGPNDGKEDNFTIDDIKNLERIRDFETLKAQAKELIKGKPARRMKPEKISWFYNRIDTLKNPLAVIKMMYDLMLAGEGNKVIGSRNSMSANSYRSRFGEQGVSEAPEDRTSYQVAKILFDKGIKYDTAKENELIDMIGMVLVKELMMSPKQARHLISYDEDFVSDTLGELGNMESSVSEVAPPGWEKTVKAMKKHDNIDNPFALAWSMKNKGYKSHKKESADPYFESLASKLDDLKKKK